MDNNIPAMKRRTHMIGYPSKRKDRKKIIKLAECLAEEHFNRGRYSVHPYTLDTLEKLTRLIVGDETYDKVWKFFYLKHTYQDGSNDYVGPFSTRESAEEHKRLYGPVDSVLHETYRSLDELEKGYYSLAMTPRQHIAYTSKRY